MVGRMPPTLPLTACAPPCHSLGAQCAYLLPDRRRSCATGGPWPARRSIPARCPSASTTTTRVSPTSPLAQHGLRRRSGPALARRGCPSRSRIRQGGQTMALAVWLSTDALHEVTGAETTDADGDAERADTDAGHPDTRTPGHWTPDARTLDT